MPLELLRAIGRWLVFISISLILLSAITSAVYTILVPPDVLMPSRVAVDDEVVDLNNEFLSISGTERLHFVVQFRRELTSAELTSIEQQLAISLDGPIPENAYMTSVSADNWEAVREDLKAGSPKAVKFLPFLTEDKLSSEIRNLPSTDVPEFALSDDDAQVFVSFFTDVSVAEQKAILAAYSASQPDVSDADIRPDPSGIWAVLIDELSVWMLAEEDAVRFVELTTPEPVEDMNQARKDVRVDALNITGEGALIAQWEVCQPTTLHPDMQGRVFPAGQYFFYCRDWSYLDLDDSGHYDDDEPIAFDANEDGTMDACLYQTANACDLTLGDPNWIELPVLYATDLGWYVNDAAGDVDKVNEDDLRLELDFLSANVLIPEIVMAGDADIGEELHQYIFADHPTLVAGTMISNSLSMQSAGEPTHPGIAPMGAVRSYAWNHLSTTAEYPNAAYAGAEVSNNSFGWVSDYYHVTTSEPYGKISRFYDVVTSGRTETGGQSTLGGRMLVVGSSGNAGLANEFWSTARIANSAKNVLSVGNVSSGESEISNVELGLPAPDSGRGPTRFGRITPILSAPGDQFTCDPASDPNCDGGITTTTAPNGYKAVRGTSFSTPIVSATAEVLSEAYADHCSIAPMPQDLRGLLVHSAQDLTNAGNLVGLDPATKLVGPDFVFGYGMPDAVKALDLIQHTVQHEISHGWVEHKVLIASDAQLVGNSGVDQLRVTLVWDDPAYYNGVAPRAITGYLQNDLDLEVIGPDGRRHLPWVLDASAGNEGNPATRRSCPRFACVKREYRDHANTIEQVVVDVPKTQIGETWTIRVRGYKIRRGPQSYTLVSEAFAQLPNTSCGSFSNGTTVQVTDPFVLPDNWFWCILFWIALIILLWLIFEAVLAIYAAMANSGYWYYGWLAGFALLVVLIAVFHLVHTREFLGLGILVLLGMLYVWWRARDP